MNSAAAAPSRVRPRRRGVFPAVRRSRAARRSSARGANANPAGQILSPVRRVERLSPWERSRAGQILPTTPRHRNPTARRRKTTAGRAQRAANPFAFAPCREAFAEESLLAWGKSFCSCAVSGGLRRGERSRAGQILSLVRRVGRPSPRGVFLRGANPFARAPCREAFAEGRVLAWGQIPSLVRRVGRPSPRGVFLRGTNPAHRPAPSEAHLAVRVDLRAGSARGLGGRSGPRVGLPKALLQQPQRLRLVATR